jgi:hypothetical protein
MRDCSNWDLLLEADRLEAAEFRWLGDQAARVQSLLNGGLRIAQEHLGWDYLSKQLDFTPRR